MPYADKEKQREFDRIWKQKRTIRLRELKMAPCVDCGIQYPPYIMEWDHLPGKTKFLEVSKMQQYKFERVLEEIAKCDLVCSNCHRSRTYFRTKTHL
jgi:hypothetical protein